MTFGEVLAAIRSSGEGAESWLAPAAPAIWAQVRIDAARLGVSTADYVQDAVAAFSEGASGEDWASLTSHLRDADDPGRACAIDMIAWRLSRSETIAPTMEGRS
jgi:hypothetical protein